MAERAKQMSSKFSHMFGTFAESIAKKNWGRYKDMSKLMLVLRDIFFQNSLLLIPPSSSIWFSPLRSFLLDQPLFSMGWQSFPRTQQMNEAGSNRNPVLSKSVTSRLFDLTRLNLSLPIYKSSRKEQLPRAHLGSKSSKIR